MVILTTSLTKINVKGGVIMIKGINRQVVEVNDTGCDYFEKIMFFVKPEYASISEGKIRERAGMIASKTTAAPPTKLRKSRFSDFTRYALAFAAGIICALGVTALINLF